MWGKRRKETVFSPVFLQWQPNEPWQICLQSDKFHDRNPNTVRGRIFLFPPRTDPEPALGPTASRPISAEDLCMTLPLIAEQEISVKAGGKQSSEDGGDVLLRNVGWLSTDYTALYPRRWYSS
jgi:hypothetical protein